ncbi:serine/threonine protein kinase [Microbulbifer flavimaris]|uniref:Serine/threonine protein kinase n=1 Tax=Microbulbifer flavimaris TaxID=1781068 RepID=A0ABX4HWJ8_9GAMM|nr:MULTISPECIES: serine/threonine-protein kinase [Microbulbifer]KUJ81575.1 hypothetical protein AVO43_13565 [Microbulbifer sp. ZGT114]PCO04479.1 serine/threonine protein kinase [Microbulbifer flavimaris]
MSSSDIHIPGYTIHSAIGHGGMASVYLATQESLNRKVAIKVLRNSTEAGIGERFINEARYIANLNSPHIITIYDISTLKNGDCYIAMEFIGGGEVADNLPGLTTVEGKLQVIRQIALGLGVVHENGIIHRDVKPSNILFREDGTAVLTDFGIAKEIDNDSDLTQVGFSLGSPSYSSPEQAQCLPIDSTTDIYSLGVVLLELLLGHNPFKGDSHTSTALNHIQLPVPELPSEYHYLAPLVNKMLAKDPGNRHQSARELIGEIDLALQMAGDAPQHTRPRRFGADQFRRLRLPALPAISLSAAFSRMLSAPASLLSRLGTTFVRHRAPLPTLSSGRLVGGLATVSLGALMVMVYFGAFYQSETEREITRLLEQAEQSMQAGRYIAPAADNARDLYRQVLQLDNTNLTAILGMKTAEQKQVEAYLAEGAQALADGRLQRPEQNNALHFFHQALAIDAKNSRAQTGIRKVIQEYIRLARIEMSESDYSDAHYYLDSGLNIAPNNAMLLSLSDEVRKREARALTQQQARQRPRTRQRQEKPPTVRTYIRSALDKLRSKMGGD